MYKFAVTWLLATGEKLTEIFEADAFTVEPNGLAIFIAFPKVTKVEFIANPQGGPPQRQAEAVGSVGGYNMIKRIVESPVESPNELAIPKSY